MFCAFLDRRLECQNIYNLIGMIYHKRTENTRIFHIRLEKTEF